MAFQVEETGILLRGCVFRKKEIGRASCMERVFSTV